MLIYKIIGSKNGFTELEEEVTKLLNKGWKPVGGISFNQGFCYQAMVAKVENRKIKQEDKNNQQILEPKELGVVDAMRKIDELT